MKRTCRKNLSLLMVAVTAIYMNMPMAVNAVSLEEYPDGILTDQVESADIAVTDGDIICEEALDVYDLPYDAENETADKSVDDTEGVEETPEIVLNHASNSETIGVNNGISWEYEGLTKTLKLSTIASKGADSLAYLEVEDSRRRPLERICNEYDVEKIVFENCKLKGSAKEIFKDLKTVKSIDCSGLDTSAVTDTDAMFSGCSSLSSVDLSGFDTRAVTSMHRMFFECSSLTSVDLSSFDTSAVDDMLEMFGNCRSLVSLDLSSFNISNVCTDDLHNKGMTGMLEGCNQLYSLITPKAFGSNVLTLPERFCDAQADKYYESLTNIHAGRTLYNMRMYNSYVVQFDGNGAEGEMAKQRIEIGTTQNLSENKFTKTGYTFTGWNTKANGSGKKYTDQKSVSNLSTKRGSIVTLYAQWKANKYTIIFNGNGATSGQTKGMENCSYGKEYSLTANAFKRIGYSFSGWNTMQNGSGTRYVNKMTVKNLKDENSDVIILYAQWRQGGYAITYNLKGGENDPGNPDNYDEKMNTLILKDPTRQGYTFKGWYSDAKLKKRVTEIARGSSGDKVFYAKWAVNKYTIHFDGNSFGSVPVTGGMPDMKNRAYDKKYTLSSNKFKKKGYIFSGWSTTRDGDGQFFKNNASIKSLTDRMDGVVTLYAQWKIAEYDIVYKLNGGSLDEDMPDSYNMETPTITLRNPSRSGYTFDGWYTDPKFKSQNRKTQIVKGGTGKVILHAKWIANKYTIIFNGNGASGGAMLPSGNCVYGKSYNLKANGYVRNGYAFKGWNTEKDGSGNGYKNKAKVKNLTDTAGGSVILYAQWESVKP